MKTTALVYDPLFLQHKTGNSPECPERLEVIVSAIENDFQLSNALMHTSPRPATITDILRCHEKSLIDEITEFCAQGGGFIDPDTFVCHESYEIALLAAGATITAVDAVMSKQVNNAFSLVRPPGHHATPRQAMGFCLFNNIAIAARYAQHKYGIKNILIIDWDVHHGNGTQDIFYQDSSVFYFSIHQSPFYPDSGHTNETGHDLGLGTTLNIPLLGGTPAAVYRQTFTTALTEITSRFKPELIMISAGFDARKGDPLADFQLMDTDFFALTQDVITLAEKYCDGKIVSTLEGGYRLDTLGESVRQHLRGLAGLT